MNIATRLMCTLLGVILIASFFMPWLEADYFVGKSKITGYDVVSGNYKINKTISKIQNIKEKPKKWLKKIFKSKDDEIKDEIEDRVDDLPKIHFIALFPITGIIAIIFSGVLRIPIATFLTALATMSYSVYNYMSGPSGGAVQKWIMSKISIGLGLYLSIFCIIAIILVSFLQFFVSKEKGRISG